MNFEQTVFERLLFPLNKEVYGQIQNVLDLTGESQKNFNMQIRYNHPDLNIEKLQFSADFIISLDYIKNQNCYPNRNYLILTFNQKDEINVFRVPFDFIAGNKKVDILKDDSNCVYSWTFHIDKSSVISPNNNDANASENIDEYLYIGLTKKTWQNRYSSHCDSIKHSLYRPLYKALNGEYGKICKKELFIEYAGLTLEEANNIEEREINERSLQKLFPYGLNKSPGGLAAKVYFAKKNAS